jgi:beta-galactosidase
MKKEYPQVAYGAVYFRKSNPPREDWARDYKQAAADGMNLFRHWFLWGAIEVAPGVYDWDDYDAQLEFGEVNGIGTVIAEFSECSPEWFFHDHKSCYSVSRTGVQAPYSGLSGSCATGGFVPGGLCLDNPETREYVERFLRALAGRYKEFPGLFGYDVWNECNYHPDMCFCEHTEQKFRDWLLAKYGSLEALGKAWYRYSYADWSHVRAPRFSELHPQCMDWLAFRKQNYYENYQWKVGIIRSVDPDARITAHGVAASLDYTYGDGNDDWLAAEQVESYGMTWVMGRKGTEPWKQWQAVDLVRAASRGKTFWHAEMQGGPLWLQPQVIGREKEDGRVAEAEDVRLWNLVSLAGGARGVLYLRWRSLLDGPLFGAFGLYSNDGAPNDRSRMASVIAKWANSKETAALFAARPDPADVGIVVLDQIQEFNRLMQQAGPGKFYARCQWGAYRAFFDSHIPVDFVHFDDIGRYRTLYFAYPIQLNADQAQTLMSWVRGGGRLICEGFPGYFGDRGKVGTTQPNSGLDEMFGVREASAEFMPDLGDRIVFDAMGVSGVPGGLFRQSYQMSDGGAARIGAYPDGGVAAVHNRYGDGAVILLGTFPSEGYFRAGGPAFRALLEKCLETFGVEPSVRNLEGDVYTRLWSGGGRRYLWLVNHDRKERWARVRLSPPRQDGLAAGAAGPASDTGSVGAARSAGATAPSLTEPVRVLWGRRDAVLRLGGGLIEAAVPGRDAIVLELL